MKITSATLTRIAVLAALVVVFDYAMKFSGFKIPFPWFPVLKFDFTGIPIVSSLLLLDLNSGAFTSIVALLAILVRSGDVVGASMKALAEFSTILGMSIGSRRFRNRARFTKPISFTLGCIVRVLVMAVANLIVLTSYYGMLFSAAVSVSPFIAAFNLVHGLLSMFGGYLIYEGLTRRVPSLVSQKTDENP